MVSRSASARLDRQRQTLKKNREFEFYDERTSAKERRERKTR